MDASELHARRLHAKEVLTPMKRWQIYIPITDGTVKIFGWEQRLRTSTLTRERPERGEEQEILREESDELHSPTPIQEDSTQCDVEAKSDFWTITGEFIYRHHAVHRVKLHVPKEESFPFPLKYIDVTRTTHISLDVLLEKQIEDHWNVDGEKFVRCMDRIHKICSTEGKATGRIYMVREKTHKETKKLLVLMMWKNSSSQWKPLGESWKFPCQQQCLAKYRQRAVGKPTRNVAKRKTKYACIVDADESTRPRIEGAGHKPHQDHITAKGMNSMTHYSLVHKFIPMPQALKKSRRKGGSGERMGKTEDHISAKGINSLSHENLVHKFIPMPQEKDWENLKILEWQLRKVRNKKEVIEEARDKVRKVHFPSLMDLCHLKNWELEPQYLKYKGRAVLRGDIVKDDSGSYAVFTEQGSSASQMTAAKVMDIFQGFQDVQDTQLMQYPLKLRSKWKMLQNYWKFSNRNVQTFGFVYHDTNGQNHGLVWKIQSFLLKGICTVILLQDCYGKAIWENPIAARLESF